MRSLRQWIEEQAKEKYRGVFEIQRSGDKTSSGEIGLDIRTHASPKVGQDQVSGGVSVLCWHAAPVAYVLWKPCTIRLKSNSVMRSRSVMVKNWCNVLSMEGVTVCGHHPVNTAYIMLLQLFRKYSRYARMISFEIFKV